MNFPSQIFDSPEFDAYLAKREIKMQKTTEGLGIMIIEGSHKVLGKAIFVSDIQQKSLAYKVLQIEIHLEPNAPFKFDPFSGQSPSG